MVGGVANNVLAALWSNPPPNDAFYCLCLHLFGQQHVDAELLSPFVLGSPLGAASTEGMTGNSSHGPQTIR